jgi:hypothetical protein
MTREPAPFPHVGSWALWHHQGRTLAVRIQLRRGDAALLSIPSFFRVASGNRTIPIAELADPTPLSPREADELDALLSRLSGQKRPRRRDLDRAEALRSRAAHARTLDGLLEKLPAKYVPEAAAARIAA